MGPRNWIGVTMNRQWTGPVNQSVLYIVGICVSVRLLSPAKCILAKEILPIELWCDNDRNKRMKASEQVQSFNGLLNNVWQVDTQC